jgi:hypothetical protein
LVDAAEIVIHEVQSNHGSMILGDASRGPPRSLAAQKTLARDDKETDPLPIDFVGGREI